MKSAAETLTIDAMFADLPDPRIRPVEHDLTEMLVVALCAILCGADSWVAIALWGQEKQDWLRRFLPLHNGVASHDTFGRVFAGLDARRFETCFIRWISAICPDVTDHIIAIDGKTVRGSRSNGKRAIHLVSAYSATANLVLGQVKTADHSNEITAIPELLDSPLLKGAIVTIDAMGCQSDIAQKIIDGQADYVLALKGNQANMAQLAEHMFEVALRFPEKTQEYLSGYSEHTEIDKDHGRIETRRCIACDFDSLHAIEPQYGWPGLRTVVMVEATRDIKGLVSTERRYYLSSLPPEAKRIAHAVRSHWRIENSMHWVLDMAFGEDHCRVRTDNAAQNLAILRRITLNLLRADTKTNAGIKIRRLKAAINDSYRAEILGLQAPI
jgi:predicted transposase YbfD/YdcC